ncbi:MAG: hypothetical protein HFH90_03950 [Lachnospiraceae bacterium]|nr:hypothetical protein [Lachnospiraceae bacterium]
MHKALGGPVVVIRTRGAFARDPLYNNPQLGKVDVSAEMEYLLSPEEIKEKTADVILKLIVLYRA